MMKIYHTPVLINEAIDLLDIKKEDIVMDCTIGEGGHSEKILSHVNKFGHLYGIDRDKETLDTAKKRLSSIKTNFTLIHGNFADILNITKEHNVTGVNKIIVDLGISSLQIEIEERGFSFKREGPLDMRMNREERTTALEIINSFPEYEIADIIYKYGEERFSRKIAKKIVNYRKLKTIKTTTELAEIIKKAYPHKWQKIHPATRTFQALRIKVNKELENLEKFLESFPQILAKNGRIAIISYHSLEDRLIKTYFKQNEELHILNKKVIKPTPEEISRNPRSRSAKLRGAKKL
ncbi:MAG: 16S rRNA (cytosine(1402)-N(4))-methyltransferase RsmH [Caldisericaceae bacterium]|nr:16S rRNA (cytosine(1402)-N(4))-methyltransferase RsmH [Caldisericaceae bacterium]